jgi:hypothetical protein
MSTDQITISGHTFNVPVRYEEGMELTAGEASALNQTYHENLRNNFAKKVKDAGASADLSALQSELDTYAGTYQFGVRTGGGVGVSRDPVMSEAMRIAKDKLRELIKKAGKKPSDFTNETITAKAKELLDRQPEILALAKQRVAEQQALASADLDLSGLETKPAAATPEAAPAEQAQG